MEFISRYTSHTPDLNGNINYSDDEHNVWQQLFTRQHKLLNNRACDEFIQGLNVLELTETSIPQLPTLAKRLKSISGWDLAPVPSLISARHFFELLAARRFPVATFIRTQDELNYIKEPDIFHELFGHCPMLTNKVYANFIHDYAKLVLTLPENDWPLLQRLFWFTVEFGLIQTPQGLRAYGGGILSSISETIYSVESDIPLRILFDPIAVFRTPYRIDKLQLVYFVIQNYDQLYTVILKNIKELLKRTRELGEYPPLFPVEGINPNIHIHAC